MSRELLEELWAASDAGDMSRLSSLALGAIDRGESRLIGCALYRELTSASQACAARSSGSEEVETASYFGAIGAFQVLCQACAARSIALPFENTAVVARLATSWGNAVFDQQLNEFVCQTQAIIESWQPPKPERKSSFISTQTELPAPVESANNTTPEPLTVKELYARLIMDKFTPIPASEDALRVALRREGVRPVMNGSRGRGNVHRFDYESVKKSLSK